MAVVIVGVVWCLTAPAHADPRAEIAARAKAAMASYDSMDYDAARKQLNQALAIAKKAKLDRDPIVARVYLDLGITELARADPEAARVAFLSAAQIDPKITVDAAYKSPDVVKLLDEARAAASDGSDRPASRAGPPAASPTAGQLDGPATPDETEDPLSDAPRHGTASAGVSGGTAGSKPRIMIAVTGGTGFGYVTGKTEGDNEVQKCCLGSSLVVLASELGYYATPRLSFGVAARIGFPIGANITGHSRIAPAGLLRVRYALSGSGTGNGLRVMGELGGGILRNTVKLDNTEPGMDTDVVAQGPLLIGAGIGYAVRLGSTVALLVDIDAIAAIAVVDKVGSAIHLNSGVSADMSVGLAVGF